MNSRCLVVVLVLLPAAACDDGITTITTTHDMPRLIAATGHQMVVVASSETETEAYEEGACGGGPRGIDLLQSELDGSDPVFGPSVMFVSDDDGQHFDRVIPQDLRPLIRIGVHAGVFYGIAQQGEGFGVVTSVDGREWSEVLAGHGVPHDLFIDDAGLAIATTDGVLTSSDGSTWVEHAMGGALSLPAVAQVGGKLVVVNNIRGVNLEISTGGAWLYRRIATVPFIYDVLPLAGTTMLVTGSTWSNGQESFGFATFDLAAATNSTVLEPVVQAGMALHPILTPVGLIERSGRRAPIQSGGIGRLEAFIAPFVSAGAEGDHVQILRDEGVTISTDGGRTFGDATALPIQSVTVTE